MRELSLHILDVMENSIRAGASIISVTIAEDHRGDMLEIVIEDDGPGFAVDPETALNPFYTTKSGKRVGLGLSLFRAASERAGGRLTVDKSPLGGVRVLAEMKLGHVDRSPMGNIAATLSAVVCANPQMDLWCVFRVDEREFSVKVSELTREPGVENRIGPAIAKTMSEKIRNAVASLKATA